MLGEAFGSFRVEGRIGRGGFGEAWLGAHAETRHKVAIKVLHAEVSALPAAEAMLAEVAKASRLSDAAIAKVYEGGRHHDGRAYVITDFIEGDSLAQKVAKNRMSSTQVADVVLQVARAAATAHAAGVNHQNLKPTNVFLVPDRDRTSGERIVVTDFCHSQLLAAAPELGTTAYMAPEQLGGTAADWRADLYSIGCIAFEMLARRPPFVAKDPAKLRQLHLTEPAPSVRALVPDVGPVVEKLIWKMLEKRPDERPRSLREVAKLFEMIAGFDAPIGETVKT